MRCAADACKTRLAVVRFNYETQTDADKPRLVKVTYTGGIYSCVLLTALIHKMPLLGLAIDLWIRGRLRKNQSGRPCNQSHRKTWLFGNNASFCTPKAGRGYLNPQ